MTSIDSSPIIDVFSSPITTDETDRFDGGVVADGIDDRDTTVDNVEDTRGETFKDG